MSTRRLANALPGEPGRVVGGGDLPVGRDFEIDLILIGITLSLPKLLEAEIAQSAEKLA